MTLVDDGEGLAGAVASRLKNEGYETDVVATGADVSDSTDGVVYLRAVVPELKLEVSDLHLDAFRAARNVAQKFSEDGGFFVTVHDNGGRFALDEYCEPLKAPSGGLGGLAKTAAREWPAATVRAIDLDAGHRQVDEIADELVEELLAGDDEVEVGRPEGERVRLQMVERPVRPASRSPLGTGDVVVVSGGARGVTAACIIELARRTGARFVLLGRTPLPEPDPLEKLHDDAELKKALLERAKESGEMPKPAELGRQARSIQRAAEIRQTLRLLSEAGSESRYVSVDVRDVNALSDALEEVRADWGDIRGLVHGAGVLRDRNIADKTDDQFELVFQTKVDGYYALAAATAQDPLKVICLFSSVAGRAGNAGQADYAMANEVLNKIAQTEARRRDDCVVKSINWGPWDGGMVGPELRKVFEERGIALIDVPTGARMFTEELLGDSDDVEIVVGSLLDPNDAPDTSDDEERAPTVVERAVRLNAETHPFLTDHVIDDTPVLPLVVAMDFFLDTCRPWFGADEIALRDVRVRRGVRLHDVAAGETSEIRIRAERTTNGKDGAKLELFDAEDELCYTARAVRMTDRNTAPLDRPEGDTPFEGTVYDGALLFHGPSLQVLQDVREPAAEGMSAGALTTRGAGWSEHAFTADPAALDAAMQLAVLWTNRKVEGLALPLAVSEFRTFGPIDMTQVDLVLRGRSANRSRTVTDVDLVDDGRVVATLRGVEVYRYRTVS